MARAGMWRTRSRTLQQVHVRRPRRSCRGELVQWDTSIHAWLEHRGPDKMYLFALIDDAFSTLQDRLVQVLRMVGAMTMEEANGYLDEVFLPEWNERFTVTGGARSTRTDWLCGQSILSHVDPRQVQNDYTVA